MENLLVPSRAAPSIPGQRILVIAPHPDDEVFGCGGAIMRHVIQGASVHVRIWTDGGYGAEPGKKADYVAARRRESVAAAKVLGYGMPDFGAGADRGLQYGEQLVQDVLALIVNIDADLVYAPAVVEMHPDHRALAMAAVEAVRRHGKGLRLAQYEVGIPLRPNLLLDISDLADRKLEAMRCFESQLMKQRYDLDVAALNRYRSFTLPPEVTAAEAYVVATSEELQGDPLGLYQSEAEKQRALGLPLDSRDLPLVSVIIRSMDRRSLTLALDSVALQTYENIEVVLINATGGTHRPRGERCGRFPLRMVEPGRPLDRGAAANCGLDAALGEFLIFLDDDDIFLPHHIARLVAEFRETEVAVGVYAGVICTNSQGMEIRRYAAQFDPVRLRIENYIPIHALLFRRAAVAAGARFDETLPVCEDWDFWLQLLEQGPFRSVNGIGAIYCMANEAGSGVFVKADETRLVVRRLYRKWITRWNDSELWDLFHYARHRFLFDERGEQMARQQALDNQRIDALENFIALKDEVIAEKDASIAKKDATIAEKQATIAENLATIAEKAATIAMRDAHFATVTADMQRYVEHLKTAVDDRGREMAGRDAYIRALHASTSWRLTAPLRRIAELTRGKAQAMEMKPPPPAQVVPLAAVAVAPPAVAPVTPPAAVPDTPPAAAPDAPLERTSPTLPEKSAPVSAEKHVYDYTLDPDSRSAPAFVCELVGSGKRVLEVGCGPGSITRVLKARGQCRVTGIDVDPVAIELARPHCETIYAQDLNAENWPQVLGSAARFDTVVAADVLEHLYDPWRTLRQMAALAGPDGNVVVSLPHAGHAALVASLVGNDLAYNKSGLLDRTHIRFFGLKNIEELFAQAHLKIVDVRFVILAPEQTELAARWSEVSEFVRAALRLSPYANIYQVVVKAVSLGQPGVPISLMNPD